MRILIYKVLVGLVVFVGFIYILSKLINPSDIRKIFLEFPKEQLLFFLLFSVIISVLKALRLLVLLKDSNIGINFWETFKVFTASQTTSPFPGGEAFRGILIHKESGTPIIKTVSPVALQAVMEPVSAVMVLVIGSYFFEDLLSIALGGSVLLGIMGFLFLSKGSFKYLLYLLPQKGIIKKIINGMLFIQKGIRELIFSNDYTFAKTFFISMLINVLGGVLIILIGNSFGINLNVLQGMLLYSSSIVIATIGAVSPGGLGFTEGGMTGLLLFFGAELPKAVGLVLTFRVVTLMFSILLGIIFLLVFYSKNFFGSFFQTAKKLL